MMYKVQRLYFHKPGKKVTLYDRLTLEEARTICRDPESSSRTAVSKAGRATTKRHGPWFNSYMEQ